MAVRIVDNKKLDMTNDEYSLYHRICKSYDEGNSKGSDLFVDLFETDDDGIITFLKPPSRRATSLEVFLFLVTLMTQQHIRVMYSEMDSVVKQMKEKIKEYDAKMAELERKICK